MSQTPSPIPSGDPSPPTAGLPPIRPRERDAILQSLRAGVVPKTGYQHIQVGRRPEVEALLRDIERVADGGASLRLVIGEYGAGKTFFLNLIRSIAHEKKLVTAQADLTPDRRLHATNGQARSLYAELMRNLSTRAKPDGGALPAVVERFVGTAIEQATARGVSPGTVIAERLQSLSELVGGYDFARVIGLYWEADEKGDETLKAATLRWLRGEFTTRTDARNALGNTIRTIIDDANFYDQVKLLARFVRLAGFGGILICLDEMVNLYKLPHSQARNSNYEQILRILNDSLQGGAEGCGWILGGTPEFLMDPRRGLFSYAALASRLEENSFAAQSGLVDFSGPVVRLSRLAPEDLYVLLGKLRHVFAGGDPAKYLVPDAALQSFMDHCNQRIGDAYFRTPRTTIRAFVDLLSVLEQNPGAAWTDLVKEVKVTPDRGGEADAITAPDTDDPTTLVRAVALPKAAAPQDEDDDELATLRLG